MAFKLNQRSYLSCNHIFASVLNRYPWASAPLILPLSLNIFITSAIGRMYGHIVFGLCTCVNSNIRTCMILFDLGRLHFHQYWLLGSNQRIVAEGSKVKIIITHGTILGSVPSLSRRNNLITLCKQDILSPANEI